jgi:hypothetical protein
MTFSRAGRSLALVFVHVLMFAGTAHGQAEIVPAEHQVYEYLLQARVRGALPEYRHEIRPMGRAEVIAHLDSLSVRMHRLGRRERGWLEQYRREFLVPEDRIEAIFDGRRIRVPRDPNSEKYFFHHQDEDWRFALNVGGAAQMRLFDDQRERIGGLTLHPAVRIQGNYRLWAGFYSESFTGQQFTGDSRVLRHDPVLSPMYFVEAGEVPQGNFERTSASFRLANRHLFAEIAHQRLLIGTGFNSPLVLADASDYYSFVRVGAQGPVIQYHFIHAALGDQSRPFLPDGNPADQTVLLAPQRYMAMHRVAVDPFPWFTFGFSEAVVYGMRGPELAYLNPVNMLWSAETALWDRDNSVVALEFIVRPMRNVETQFTWLVDDMKFDQIGQNSLNNRWGIQAGLGVGFDGGLATLEYTRIEPWVYTHRFYMDGSFYNAYHHNRFSLGHPIGPNSDRLAAGARMWMRGRMQGGVEARYVRRGENHYNDEGEFVNVGRDINKGFAPPYGDPLKIFLAGDRFEGAGAALFLSAEPFRGITFRVLADYQRWDREVDVFFSRWEMVVNL